MARNGRTRDDASEQIPGAREKGAGGRTENQHRCPELRRLRRVGSNPAKGIRQISHVTSG